MPYALCPMLSALCSLLLAVSGHRPVFLFLLKKHRLRLAGIIIQEQSVRP